MTLSKTVIAFGWALLACGPARAEAPSSIVSIAICEDENEWPPYSYFVRDNGRKSARLAGYAVDVVDEIFNRNQIAYRIDMIPWSRCLPVAALGKQYQMVLNLSYSDERMKAMLLSRPYYTATTYYFYSRRRYPNGPAIKSLADLQQYRICGVRGYNYAGYGLATGSIDQGAGDFTALIAKLHLGRCQLFLEKNEVMMGYAAIGRDYLADPDIGRAPMPGLKPVQFHLGISRHYPQAEALRTLLDAELAKMEQSGRLHDIWQRAVQHLKP